MFCILTAPTALQSKVTTTVCSKFPSSNVFLGVIGIAHDGSSLVFRHPVVNLQNKTEKSIIFLRLSPHEGGVTIRSGGLHFY